MMLKRGLPDIELKPTGNTIAQYCWWYLGPVVYRQRIRLDWRKTRAQYRYNDADLTVKALNEEIMHFVLIKHMSEKACSQWDNLPRDTRMFLQD